jgi:hypothetical protein
MAMTDTQASARDRQSLAMDDFLYFFLRLRKQRIRVLVQGIRERFPEETREQHARRLIASHAQLSFLGGSLLHLPMLLPGVGQVLKVLGFVTGASALTRMHIYLILEIALLYGQDIDDQARVPEMMAVVAATSAAAAAPLLVHALELNPLIAVPLAGITATSITQLIGGTAMQYYGKALVDTATPENIIAQPA